MKTVCAGENSVSIWFSGEAVPTRSSLLALVNRALAAAGHPLWPGVEAECFASGEDALILARPGPARPRAFLFPSLESLLAGILSGPVCESRLYDAAGGYLLVLAAERPWPGLFEWGEERDLSPDREVHDREQGRCLADGNACADLRRFFSTP